MAKRLIHIRPVRKEDHRFIIDMASRFLDFPQEEWRDREKMLEVQIHLAKEAIAGRPHGSELYVAADEEGNLLGYILLGIAPDFYTGESRAYAYTMVVNKETEGKGVGKILMKHAEDWAREKGYKHIALSVLAKNTRALSLYQKAGYQPEAISLVKFL